MTTLPLLAGGGYAGRLSPVLDVTLDEQAAATEMQREGRVLPLLPTSSIDGMEVLSVPARCRRAPLESPFKSPLESLRGTELH